MNLNNNKASWESLAEWFILYRAGDTDKITPLFQSLSKILKAFYFVRTQSLPVAEDLTQVALLKIHIGRNRFDKNRALKTWVFTIANRCLIDHWRTTNEEEIVNSDLISQVINSEWIEKLEWKHSLEKALKTLKPMERSILYLYAVEGLSMGEIAESFNLSRSAVKVRAHRNYAVLRKLLSEGVFS